MLLDGGNRRKNDEMVDNNKLTGNIPQTVGQRGYIKADFINLFQREGNRS